MLRNFLNKTSFFVLIIVLLAIPASLALTKPGFFPTQDYIYVARVYQMHKALQDGQFPVRWVSDFRYGEPLFNFYAPLPYYAGALIKFLGFDYLTVVKILFALGFILSSMAMFFLARQFWGNLGGLLASTLYLYAPYHSSDVYVRGALSESWALIFFPLILLYSFKLIEKASAKNIVFLALSLAGLFFTHNIMTVLFTPFLLAWCAFLIWQKKDFRKVKSIALALVLGVGLASTFMIPAFFEKDLVQSDKLIKGYFDYRAHFVTVKQFFITDWGYGASLWGPKDDMSFQVGLSHWAALVLVLGFLALSRNIKERFLLIALGGMFAFSLFMQHNRSAPIWESFSLLAYTQFPWRFLGLSIFFISLLGGALTLFLNKKLQPLVFLLIIGIIAMNINFFRPESYYLDSVDDHYMSDATLAIDDKLPKDYLPIWVKYIDKEKKISDPYVVEGQANISEFNKKSTMATFKISVSEDSQIEAPITYYPGWAVLLNNQKIALENPSELGLIKFKAPRGEHTVRLELENTPIRTVGNIVSLVSIILLIVLLGRPKIAKRYFDV